MRRLYIDPGTSALGLAEFTDRVLTSAIVSKTRLRGIEDRISAHWRNARIAMSLADVAAVEHMQYRPTDSTPQDLIDVQAVGCAVAGLLADSVRLIKPSEWKGTVPKPIHHARLVGVLSAEERAVLGDVAERALRRSTRGHDKEVLDAVGIGLYDLGRTNRSGGERA